MPMLADVPSSDLHVVKCRESGLLSAVLEVIGREPALERGLARRPFGIEHGEICGVAVAALGDGVLAQHALEYEAVAQRRTPRDGVECIAFPFVAPIAERLEG